ncbi:MAG TPA: hypothetical protein DCG49_08500 [Ruminococcus sp.]|nr:hypothetical protein [Ruminococcus sp.]
MGQDELDKRLRALHNTADSFSIPTVPDGSFKSAKKLGRKMTDWYVQPFGAAQNDFNNQTADTIAELKRQVDRLREQIAETEERTMQRDADLKQELRQEQRNALARSNTAQQQAFEALTASIDRTLSYTAPERRSSAGVLPLTKLPVIGTEALFQEFRAVQGADSSEDAQKALDVLGADYRSLLEDSVRKLTSPQTSKPIALVVRSFMQNAGMEAIRNEVWDLYMLLRDASRYPACILSIEPDSEPEVRRGDVHYVPEKQVSDWLRRFDPALLIFCESTSGILKAADHSMLLRNAIVRLSGQNPLQGVRSSSMQEFVHLCDLGVQHYCTASQYAANVMEEYGFRRPEVLYPYIDLQKPIFCRKPRAFDPAHVTIGFASSPMLPEQSESRGIPALCQVVQQNPDMHFIVLWRDAKSVPVPTELEQAENCEVRLGKCDMTQFFEEIDCVLIPYADENFNHACSLSAVEGMIMGIPAVATPEAGVSELIDACGLGIVANGTDADAISNALRQIPAQYPAFREAWRTEKLLGLISGKAFVRFAEDCIAESVPQGVHTLYEWDRQLKQENRHLVRGAAALKAYYQRQEVASNYTEDRFTEYPQNCFDLMERKSVSVLLEHYLAGNPAAELLDLACGNGRIMQELRAFGHCTACDASPAMLNVIRERFADDPPDVREADLLSFEPDQQYDAVTIFRFIRHYEYGTRRQLWAKLHRALKENGVLLFDVPNVRFEIPHRQKNGWGKYHIYDVFWTRASIEKELADNGFRLLALVPVGQGLYPMPAEYRNEPMTWTAAVTPVNTES